MPINYPAELNDEQLDVVLHGDGPCLVLAGAGSGKTRVITYRVAYLLEQGVSPQNILLVTFTNRAANEMMERVAKLVSSSFQEEADSHSSMAGRRSLPELIAATSSASPPEPPLGKRGMLPWAGTFHSIAYKILRQYAPLLGYKNNFSVLDSDDSEALIKMCAKPFKTDAEKFPSSSVLKNIISYSRNAEAGIEDVLNTRYEQWSRLSKMICAVADAYERKKKEGNVMDFDDLLVNLLLLLNKQEILDKFSEQFKYVLVDEYQDTNKLQATIIAKLGSKHQNVLVVGDDAQSIYSFRAADIANILNFEKEYPQAKIFKLEKNYRSSQEILNVANDVISNNFNQYKKNLRAFNESGAKPSLHPQMDQASEAQFIVNKILEQIDAGANEREIAVLFRAAHHTQMLEMELVKAGIAYDYRGGLRFFERAHIKDVLSYLRIINNLSDTAAWMRSLTREEGIGPAGASRIIDYIKQIENIDQVASAGAQVLGERGQQGWGNFSRVWNLLTESPKTPSDLIGAVLDSPYRDYLENEYIDSKERLDDLAQLKTFASQHDDLEQFLAEASLQESFNLRGQNSQILTEKKDSGPKIILSTIHQAKGLEWQSVFVINLASGAFPNDRALRETGGLEEERRLFYVAITRAKKNLCLTYPMAGGGWGDSVSGPSIFLGEIASNLIDDHSLLSDNLSVFNDVDADVEYVSEDKPLRVKPGSFLRSVDDL